jgi:hypothetical protein
MQNMGKIYHRRGLGKKSLQIYIFRKKKMKEELNK